MTVLVVGATGATGKLLVEQLLKRGHQVRVIVRSRDRLPDSVRSHPSITIVEANLLDLADEELGQHVSGCDAVASCLGHNLTFKGLFGNPRRLVTDATRRLCRAIEQAKPTGRVRFVLMNTAGNRNRDLDEPATFANRIVVGLIRWAVPPHADNEQASGVLRQEIGKNNSSLSWVVVRPDSLVNQSEVTEYELAPSPTRDPIFNAGTTSRINVAHFMADLATDREVWEKWVGQMPVIYNREEA
ncbi:NAD-dependent epimerase [Blastopirellula marina]|uniref:NAD-dependent epimerase n=1 Tax=Blastopirellula marina TaxID=124 RepID=A0A2S8FTX7_9BACT|nr:MULTISPECIES: NAD(P)-binding oxidoreductase [Pirellulaceae]PQO35636.1 NAD-dependent epimerase [Blastopirellula marina]RCS53210.1 NAD(P)-dependent oxidoreductase [Bremerella cremea]